jgi:hypothetical protein
MLVSRQFVRPLTSILSLEGEEDAQRQVRVAFCAERRTDKQATLPSTHSSCGAKRA